MGYGYEALRAFVKTMFMQNKYESLLYESDVRNHGSIALVEKFANEKGSFEELAAPSGKQLQLQSFYILKQD